MNTLIKILPLLLCIIFLVGCEKVGNHQIDLPPETTCPLVNNTPSTEEELKNGGTDIYYKILSATNTECKVKIIVMSCTEMTCGKAFYLEKEVNGAFEKVEWKNEAYFHALAYLVKSDEPLEMTYSWKDFLGELEKGKYRIATDFYRDGEKITAYFQFEV